MTTQQPTSIQNMAQIKDTFNYTTATSTIITKAPEGKSKVQEHEINSESEQQLEARLEENGGKKKRKNKKKKKNSVPIEAVPIDKTTEQQPKTSQNQVSQHVIIPQPAVVRHKISQIKRNLFTESSSSVVLPNSQKQEQIKKLNQNSKDLAKEQLNDKEMKAISSMFGQFFKVQNLKNYQKAKQTVAQVKPAQSATTTRRIIKTVKPLNDTRNIQSLANTQTIQSIEQIAPSKSSLETINEAKPVEDIIQETQKLYTRISENSKPTSCKKLSTSFIQQLPTNAPRSSYQQPQFQLIQPLQTSPLNQQLTNSPLVQHSAESISFDEEKPISPQSFEQFLNNNQFKHPLLECESRGSFPMEEFRPLSNEGDCNKISNIKEVRSIEIVCNSNNKNSNSKRLTNLRLNQNNARFCESHEFNFQDLVQTPFFQLKQRDSEFELMGDLKVRNVQQSPGKKLQKTHSQSNPFHIKQQPTTFSHVSQIIKQSPKQIVEPNTHSKASLMMSQIYPKRLNTFLPMQQEMGNIERIFKDFNRENKMMIDVLSYSAGFETVEEVSSNLVNQMEKEQEDEFVREVVMGRQREWRRLLGVKGEIGTPRKEIYLSSSKLPNNNNNNNYQINRPSPTKTCSPSKYIYLSSNYPTNPQPPKQKSQTKSPHPITNKSPLRLPTFSHNSFPSHAQIDYEINDGSGYRREEEGSVTNGLEESLRSFDNNSNSNGEKGVLEQQRQLNGFDQKEEIRAFYDYLQSKQSTYQAQVKQNEQSSQSNHSLSARNFDTVCYRHERTASNQQKIVPTFQNLHQIKETSKPLLLHNSSKESMYLGLQSEIKSQPHNNVFPFISGISPQNLETLAMNFRRKNPVGGHTNLKDETISLAGSIEYQHNEVKKPFYTRVYDSFNLLDENQHPTIAQNKNVPKISIPIHSIQPIKFISKSKSKSKTKKEKQTLGKNQKISTVPVKKMKVVSAINPTTQPQKSIQMPKSFNPAPMTGFLMTPSNLGTMMLNNAFKSYIVPHKPQSEGQLKEQPRQKQPQSIEQHQAQQLSTKKKVTITSKIASSSKKLSINQKTIINSKPYTQPINKKISDSAESTTRHLFTKLNPQLQQTISRINQKPQKQLLNLIKSRITERSHSKESSKYQTSTLKKPKDESRMVENESFLSNYQIESGYTDKKKKNHRDYSGSKEKQYKQSRNSSRSSKKSGLELWNEGLSSLKQSRRQNGSKSPKIFKEKSHRQNEKVIGITRWNQNLSKLKQSRSKSRQSGQSFGKSSTFRQSNRKENLNQSNGFGAGQKTMNVQIKKHKYQVNNVQKRYL